MNDRKRRFAAAVILAALAIAVPGASEQSGNQPPPAACGGPEYRQFSFWIGEWDVYEADGKRAGHNVIASAQHGCAVIENWKGVEGHTGTSLNYDDRATGLWYQSWISEGETALRLAGGIVDGNMILTSEPTPSAKGGRVINRITWFPVPQGDVRQLWEASRDNGAPWTVVFDGTYKRR